MSNDSDREELFQLLTARTTVTEDCRGVWKKKYENEKQFFRTLPLRGHVGLPTDKMAMSLVPEDLPLEPEIAATRTSPEILLFSRNGSQVYTSKVARFPLNYVNSSVSVDRNCN